MTVDILKDFDNIISEGSTENANKDSRIIPTQRDLVAGLVSKEKAKEIIPKHIMECHEIGNIHIHDLDYSPAFSMFNCMLIHLEGMLTKGFRMGNAEIETPKSISTATAITAQVIAQVASHIYGGNSINRIDEVLAPYVSKSYKKHLKFIKENCELDKEKSVLLANKMIEKETYDAFQALEYEINTLHTSNGQTPFTTIGFGLGSSWEHRLIQKCILEVRRAGLGKNKRTAIFPKLVYTIKEGLNRKKTDINYDIKQLALKCASERMYPDILNYDKLVEVTGGFKAPMGCRSFVYGKDNEANGRNNLGVVSLNIPRAALLAKDKNDFWIILDTFVNQAKEALDVRVNRLRGVKASVAPILYTEGACGIRLNPEDDIFQIFDKSRASISLGYIGLHEACITLGEDPLGNFGVEILDYLRNKTDKWKNKEDLGYSLYSTPSESLCDRFWKLDRKMFGDKVCNKGYYTNSFHIDVRNKVNPFQKIDFEAKFPKFANGGFISYVEFPNMKNNLKGLELVWDYTYDKLPYFGTNTPVDHCGLCGFSGETLANFVCPVCGNKDTATLSVVRRVCGYLGNPDTNGFNEGKQSEVNKRVKHI